LRRLTTWGFALLMTSACGTQGSDLALERRAFVDELGDTVWGDFGYLTVPVWHDRPAGDSIRLAVARFAAVRDVSGPPIIYLEGGPGAAAIHPERLPLLNSLRRYGEVVTFDQRGTGASEPDLSCGPPIELSAGEERTRAALLEAERREAARCAQDLVHRGIDLDAYDVLQSADDVDALRTALGADRVRLVGISFGSHLGLMALKRHGSHISRLVLAGAEGWDQTVKLPSNLDRHLIAVSRMLAADSVAGRYLPDFAVLVERTASRSERRLCWGVSSTSPSLMSAARGGYHQSVRRCGDPSLLGRRSCSSPGHSTVSRLSRM
jgi:pimeloyl-ACP methyl ester carboxylesterase